MKDSPGSTVQTVRFAHGRGPVFYASMPCANQSLKGCGTKGTGERHRLVSSLWDHLLAMEGSRWERCQSFNGAALPIQVVRGLLGGPHLLLGEHRGPGISFSESGGRVWAALCGDEFAVGIDVAGTDEFQSEYPFSRVFHPQELEHALALVAGNLEEASALLWSIKEAVVKALGCAFHFVDPRQIIVYESAGGATGGNGAYAFPVGLSGKAVVRFPMAVGRSLWVHSLSLGTKWLSIALLNWQPR